ncbi:MAG: hypothetical protein ACJZ4Z_00425 [Candidatus Thalassarchaeaceae archaeon]
MSAICFMEEDTEEQNLVSEQPSSVFIGGPAKVESTLSGFINQNNENKNIKFWGNSNIEKSSTTPPWAWFLIGLIPIPLALSIISILVISIPEADFLNEEYSNNPQKSEDVTFDSEYFEVYIFDLSSRFESIFAEHRYWDLNIESSYEYSSYEWGSYISGNDKSIDQNQIIDDEGMIWYDTDIHDNPPENIVVYVRVVEDNVHVALKSETPRPTYVHYYFEGNDWVGDSDTLFWGTCMIWPITIILGTIWGFRTNRKPLAYGILTWGIVAIILMGLFSFAWFIGW